MSVTTARCFQDKLAMRAKALEVGIPQPDFVASSDYEGIDRFIVRTNAPWMLKPRIGASSMGIKKLDGREAVWRAIADLHAREAHEESSAFHLLEQYIPGDVYHVDSLVDGSKILFASVEHYGRPPFEVSQIGGVTVSHTVGHGSREQRILLALNERLLAGFGFERGVTHAEFIRRADSGEFYFLEVAARVGGAHTAETIAAATGIDPWREWARIELASPDRPYQLPQVREDYAGLAISLAREEHPCTASYTDPEIVYRVNKPWHVGLIVSSPDNKRVIDLLASYERRFTEDFTAVAPPEETPEQHL
jgi:biotin carboxylase